MLVVIGAQLVHVHVRYHEVVQIRTSLQTQTPGPQLICRMVLFLPS